jgi:hypothetical protein
MIVELLRDLLTGFNFAMLAYFALLNVIYTVLLVLGWRAISAYVRRRRLIDYDEIARSPLTMPISMIVPAYNEGPVIVDARGGRRQRRLDRRHPRCDDCRLLARAGDEGPGGPPCDGADPADPHLSR